MLIRKRQGNGLWVTFRTYKAKIKDNSLQDWTEVELKNGGKVYLSVTAFKGRRAMKYQAILQPSKHFVILSIGDEKIAEGLFQVAEKRGAWKVDDKGSLTRKIRRKYEKADAK